jgi:DNA-binding transcriptional LysR family regulator
MEGIAMNLVQLRYVKAVVSNGSFSKAARYCGVSQPTISSAISEFEAGLGGKLFHRTTRFVELTPFGLSMIHYVDEILSLVEDMQQEAEANLRPEQKLIRIAFSPIVDSPRLISMFDGFREENPECDFVYKECGVEELETRLGQEKIDVICGIRIHESTSLCRSVLYWDTLRYLPRGGLETYTGPNSVTLNDIAKELMIFTVDLCGLAPATRDLFKRQKLKLNEYPGHPLSYHVLQEWSREGIGSAILPESRITGDAKAYPLVVSNTGPVMIAVEAIWMRNNKAHSHFRNFAAYLNDQSQSGFFTSSAGIPYTDGKSNKTPVSHH